MLKTSEEISQAIEMLSQETDQIKKTCGRHLLQSQFRQAFERITELERMNRRLTEELSQYPEYRQKEMLKAFNIYVDIFGKGNNFGDFTES